jgi:hypothetical protein
LYSEILDKKLHNPGLKFDSTIYLSWMCEIGGAGAKVSVDSRGELIEGKSLLGEKVRKSEAGA